MRSTSGPWAQANAHTDTMVLPPLSLLTNSFADRALGPSPTARPGAAGGMGLISASLGRGAAGAAGLGPGAAVLLQTVSDGQLSLLPQLTREALLHHPHTGVLLPMGAPQLDAAAAGLGPSGYPFAAAPAPSASASAAPPAPAPPQGPPTTHPRTPTPGADPEPNDVSPEEEDAPDSAAPT